MATVTPARAHGALCATPQGEPKPQEEGHLGTDGMVMWELAKTQGRALYGPILVNTETSQFLKNFERHWSIRISGAISFPGGNSYGPIIRPYLFLGKFAWTNGPESSSKVFPPTLVLVHGWLFPETWLSAVFHRTELRCKMAMRLRVTCATIP